MTFLKSLSRCSRKLHKGKRKTENGLELAAQTKIQPENFFVSRSFVLSLIEASQKHLYVPVYVPAHN